MATPDPYAEFSTPVGGADPYAEFSTPVAAQPRPAARRQQAGPAPSPALAGMPEATNDWPVDDYPEADNPNYIIDKMRPEFAAQQAAQDGGPMVWDDLTGEQRGNLKRGDRLQLPTGEVVTLSGSPFVDQSQAAGDRQGGQGIYLREPNLADSVEAFATAASEQVPFLDEAAAAVSGAITGKGFDATREQQMLLRELLNETNRGERIAGGIGGAGLSLALPGGSLIKGTKGARAARAAAMGTGYGGLFGFANTDGGFGERATGAGIGAALGGILGGSLQATGDAAVSAASKARGSLSPQRQLSNAGVQLTPGQIFGGAAQTVEDALGGTLPVFGDAINAAKRRGLESFDNVATNIALEPIGVQIPNSAGRQGVRLADDAVSGAYGKALSGVTVTPDAPFEQAVTAARQPQGLTPSIRRNLGAVLDNILDPLGSGPVTGQAWKEADSQLAAAIRAADKATDSAPEQRIMRERLTQARDALGDLLERTDPFVRADVKAADRASATYRIVREATADAASAGRDGNTSPAALNRRVRASAGGRQFARGEGLLQDLTDNAMQVLPNTVPNSGTALRAALGGGLLTGAVFQPVTAAATGTGLLAGAGLYSRPAQKLINDVYRATSPGQARQALGGLQLAAARSPALAPIAERLSLELGLLRASGQQGPLGAPSTNSPKERTGLLR